MKKTSLIALALTTLSATTISAQEINDSNTPLHLMKPAYDTPYGAPSEAEVKATIDRVLTYLEESAPAKMDGDKLWTGSFRLTSYEMGVTYNACIDATKRTGDQRYIKFTSDRYDLIRKAEPKSRKLLSKNERFDDQMRKVCMPTALDDCGSMCAAYSRLLLSQGVTDYSKVDAQTRLIIDRYLNHVYKNQYRLADGTLARIRPHYSTVWLDDMYMGIPCLALYGKLTGKTEFYDEAVRQICLFRDKMAVPQAGDGSILFRHGWVEEMQPHPFFPWGRANGWAILTLCEVLDVLPADHLGRTEVLDLLRAHIAGLCAIQDKTGFWHQLLTDPSSYLETSATAIYTYCLAHAICEGWVDPLAYGAQTLLAWNATATQVNERGQVMNTCVGSGMGFDPAFYCYRPVHPMAAHGYGPVIWAGSEIIRLLRTTHPKMNDSAIHFYPTPQLTDEPIFSEQRKGLEDEKVLW